MSHMTLLKIEVQRELDVVLARQRARQIAHLLGFAHLDQTRIATATSEIARNAMLYAGGGRVEFLVETGSNPSLQIRIRERGSGVSDFHAILDGRAFFPMGVDPGITGAKRLMDAFTIESEKGVARRCP